MGCLNVNISELGYRISPNISWLGGIVVDALRVDKPINCGVTDTSGHLKINCGVICSINNYDYASACYDNTQRHISEANTLTTIKAIEAYDYPMGYLEKLRF